MGTIRGNANASGTRYAPPEPRDASIGLSIGPQRSLSRREAEYQIIVGNAADHVETVALFVDSPALDLHYTFQPTHLRVAAHSQAGVRLQVRAWSEPDPNPHPFIVSALRSGSLVPVARAAAEFIPNSASRRPFPLVPAFIGGGLALLVCTTGLMAFFAWQVFRSRDAGAVVAYANPTAAATVAIAVTGGASGGPAKAPTATPPLAPTSTAAPANAPTATPPPRVNANPEAALVNYYANINQRVYALTWASLSPRFQSEFNQNNLAAYEDFWNSVARVTVLNTKLLSQVDDTATVRATLRYVYNDGRVVDEATSFRLIADASRLQWLIDAVVR